MESQSTERGPVYRYRFGKEIPVTGAKEALFLAAMASESLHGRARVQLEASFRLDVNERTCVVDAGTDVGRDIARVFTGYLTSEFGEGAFSVERVAAGGAEPR
jgi:hypothetical protein